MLGEHLGGHPVEVGGSTGPAAAWATTARSASATTAPAASAIASISDSDFSSTITA